MKEKIIDWLLVLGIIAVSTFIGAHISRYQLIEETRKEAKKCEGNIAQVCNFKTMGIKAYPMIGVKVQER